MDEEDILVCHQCSGEAESLEACAGGCGKELCPYCQRKCHECADRQTIQRIDEEEEEERKRKEEAEKQAWQPERSLGQKIGRALDWASGFADGALRRELEYYEGEFDMYDDDNAVQEMMKLRWKDLPDWKKKIYKAKKKSEMFIATNVLRAGMKGGRLIGGLGRPMRLRDDTSGCDDDTSDFQDYDGYDDLGCEDYAGDDVESSDDQDFEEDVEDDAESGDEQDYEDHVEEYSDEIDCEEEEEDD